MNDHLNILISWEKSFALIETLVVSGQHLECRRQLDLLNPKTIPREWASRFAELANRVHHPLFALKALHRFVVRNSVKDPSETDREKMIYAYALCLLGAADEALVILDDVDTLKEPEAIFMKALTYFRQWKYTQSLPLLKSFMSAPGVAPYRQLVGNVNTVAALISSSEYDEALSRLVEIQTACREGEYSLLLGNSYELQAQILFFQKKYEDALSCLQEARKLLSGQQGLYLLFVEKWTLLCQMFLDPSSQNIEKLHELRQKAVELNDFETVRECELFESVVTKNEELLRKVIMGTPSEQYRQRARALFGKTLKPYGQFKWILTADSLQDPILFDPYEKQLGRSALYEQPHLLALFQALSVDFYRPCYLGALFKHVYPTEKFNPYTSPPRVMRLLKRLDNWLEAQQVPIRIEFKKSEFALRAIAPVAVVIQRGQKMSSVEGRWSEIKSTFDGRVFTSAKISEAIGISQTSAQRLIKQALEERRIQAVGRGRGTAYRFVPRNKGKLTA